VKYGRWEYFLPTTTMKYKVIVILFSFNIFVSGLRISFLSDTLDNLRNRFCKLTIHGKRFEQNFFESFFLQLILQKAKKKEGCFSKQV